MKKRKTFKAQIVAMIVITCMLSSCASYTTIRSTLKICKKAHAPIFIVKRPADYR